MVRVGGGYVTIQEYYNRYATKQCVSMYQIMSNKGTTFLDTVLNLIQTAGVSPEILAQFTDDNESWQNTNTLFILLATFTEEKTRKEKAKKNKKPKKKTMTSPGNSSLINSYGDSP